ncbi:MAG: sulfurtransferase TusA family protein [Bacillota bacterium]
MSNKLDCIGEPCPLPLMKVEKKINQLRVGEKLKIEVDHTCAMTNVPEWARKRGYEVESKEVNFGEWEITIAKTR